MRTFRHTLLALLLSAALAILGPRQSFSALERLSSSCLFASQDAMPYVPYRTGMSRHGNEPSEAVTPSLKNHLQESRNIVSPGEYLFLPKQITFSVFCRVASAETAFQEMCSRLFLTCGVTQRKLIPRESPFFSF